MRVKIYTKNVSVYLDDVKDDDRSELAGMLTSPGYPTDRSKEVYL